MNIPATEDRVFARFHMPRELWAEIKAASVKENRPIYEILEDALAQYLDRRDER